MEYFESLNIENISLNINNARRDENILFFNQSVHYYKIQCCSIVFWRMKCTASLGVEDMRIA